MPVTVLSRCQRFDLRRVDADVLVKHLQGIAETEKIEVEPEALALIARAAEGSVRDSLSLFDQAIAHAAGTVRGEDVRQMLGLADRTRTIDLFEAVMRGDAAGALKELRAQYDIGADPAVALSDLAEFTHFVTRVKVVPAVADDVSFAESERVRGRGFAEKLSMRVLSRAWQMLLKGITEVEEAGRPLAAAEMVLVRIAYAADLPTPDEVIRSLDGNGAAPAPRAAGNGGAASSAPSALGGAALRRHAQRTRRAARRAPRWRRAQPIGDPRCRAGGSGRAGAGGHRRFEDLIALAAQKRDLSVKAALERDVRLVRCEDGRLDVALEPSAAKTLVNDLAQQVLAMDRPALDGGGVARRRRSRRCKSQLEARQAELKTGVQADPLVQAVLARFPGAEDRRRARARPDRRRCRPAIPTTCRTEPPPADEDSYGADWVRDDNPED